MEGSGWVLVPEVRQSPITQEGRQRTGICSGVGRVWSSVLLAGVIGFIAQTRIVLQWKRPPLKSQPQCGIRRAHLAARIRGHSLGL